MSLFKCRLSDFSLVMLAQLGEWHFQIEKKGVQDGSGLVGFVV